MAVSDALVVGEDWISEHYFTTDATKESFLARVLERRKEWEALEKPADPGTAPTPTPRSRFRSERSRLEELLAALKARRLETANAASQPAFVIFTDATLQAIAEATPVDRSQLLRISGIGAVKADRFGEDVLRIIAERIAPGQ